MSTVNIWDYCKLDPAYIDDLEKWQEGWDIQTETKEENKLTGASPSTSQLNANDDHYQHLEQALIDAESSCRASLELLDKVLMTTEKVQTDFEDVTGRTNSLMAKCEALLDQQHALQHTVEVLQETLKPFNEIEEVANVLGIPMPSRPSGSSTNGHTLSNGHTHTHSSSAESSITSSNIDVRSPEFIEILSKLSRATAFLKKNRDIHDADMYLVWLEQLQHRAVSLVGRSMKDLLEAAASGVREARSKRGTSGAGAGAGGLAIGGAWVEDTPLESNALYTKFRPLTYRFRELAQILAQGGLAGEGLGESEGEHAVLSGVRRHYLQMRGELLPPLLKEQWLLALALHATASPSAASANAPSSSSPPSAGASTDHLQHLPELAALFPAPSPSAHTPGPSPRASSASSSAAAAASASAAPRRPPLSLLFCARSLWSVCMRGVQSEAQLFYSLFGHNHNASSSASSAHSGHNGHGESSATPRALLRTQSGRDFPLSPSSSEPASVLDSELQGLVGVLSGFSRDLLRPLVIQEKAVDELTALLAYLTRDLPPQVTALPAALLPPALHALLLQELHLLGSDVSERLLFCAGRLVREEVEDFTPLPSHLTPCDVDAVDDEGPADPAKGPAAARGVDSWYPPLRSTLSLLSKLYTVLEKEVFEHLALQVIPPLLASLRSAAQRIQRIYPLSPLHAKMFLVRALVTLREQLLPFNLKLQDTKLKLDFTPSQRVLGELWKRGASASGGGGGTSGGGLSLAALSSFSSFASLLSLSSPLLLAEAMDGKKVLDQELKLACGDMKDTAVQSLLAPLPAFLVKVQAFAGEVPDASLDSPNATVGGRVGVASEETPANASASGSGSGSGKVRWEAGGRQLKGQAFVKAERMREVLEGVRSGLANRLPDFKKMMRVYIENASVRNVLGMPVLQESLAMLRKMEVVVESVLDEADEARRELLQAVRALTYTLSTELSSST